MIAALYVHKKGPYVNRPDVDAWDIDRDARKYNGPYPVVAHPPCGHWGTYHHLCHDDGHTGPIAVDQVRRWGGVLEQPKRSKLWVATGLIHPTNYDSAFCLKDQYGGYTIEVNQYDWEHRALKPTWLYIVGCDRKQLPERPEPRPRERLSERNKYGKLKSVCELLSKNQRAISPPTFAEWLIEIAERCKNDGD
jgi:hypothetical protein